MAMDVFGKKPIAPEGECFQRSHRRWGNLAYTILTLCPGETAPSQHWCSNDGDGLSAEQALALADALDDKIATGQVGVAIRNAENEGFGVGIGAARLEKFLLDEESGRRKGGFDKSTLLRLEAIRATAKAEKAEVEDDVVEFVAFLRASGGFEIW